MSDFQLVSADGVVAEGSLDEEGKIKLLRTREATDGYEYFDSMDEVTRLFSYAEVRGDG